MATPAHCYYCFESLYASFQGNKTTPQLSVIENLWEEFEASKDATLGANLDDAVEVLAESDKKNKERATELPVDTDGSDKEHLGGEEAIYGSEDGGQMTSAPSDALQPPSIRRLQGGLSSSRSSSSSTPSATSTSSSRSVLTGTTSMTSTASHNSTLSLNSTSKSYSERLRSDSSNMEYPLFVTWNTMSRSGHKALRGCIGTFEPQDLQSGLSSYARTSAFDDTRFSPIPASLLPSLSCSLTLLSSFEPCSHALDWDLATHGIRISFTHRRRRYGATYLPDVAVEQGWTKEETVESLMRKAGWDGPSSYGNAATRRFLRGAADNFSSKPWEDVADFKTVRYQGLKSSATYTEWQEWREWVESSAVRRSTLSGPLN